MASLTGLPTDRAESQQTKKEEARATQGSNVMDSAREGVQTASNDEGANSALNTKAASTNNGTSCTCSVYGERKPTSDLQLGDGKSSANVYSACTSAACEASSHPNSDVSNTRTVGPIQKNPYPTLKQIDNGRRLGKGFNERWTRHGDPLADDQVLRVIGDANDDDWIPGVDDGDETGADEWPY
ncbi:hypothetical protein LTS08_005180 [Lithohypha guttulata]|uniref:uncharacterized protein n=1 Tax=Lithohypha guttulata TaxID=1690604 RepID=UPI002DE16D28|nr:hypothetical protein LTR51_004811 [Lithohypha guttulata]KAK5100431.1 hypothetical protein LTS08_005180 [Lithohypha guttulata]